MLVVHELIEKLKELPQNLPVVLCNLEDDGDGDGLANLHEIVSAEVLSALSTSNSKKEDVIIITYRDYK
jgi:hypothetical protein